MSALIKKYTPYFQFAAVVVTVALGVHSMMEKFLENTGPCLEVTDKRIFFTQGSSGRWDIDFSINLYRDDCVPGDKYLKLEDEDGFLYDIEVSAFKLAQTRHNIDHGKTNLPPGEYDLALTFFLANAEDHEMLIGKKVKLVGTITQQCPDGLKVAIFPETPKLVFEYN